mmetsp:Transcript_13831/g.49100  ORF Transcript_13831/g.49100 Transcript_13831/m.49100 type:complete len:338 (-) Transcript_13831:1574-2587(-)
MQRHVDNGVDGHHAHRDGDVRAADPGSRSRRVVEAEDFRAAVQKEPLLRVEGARFRGPQQEARRLKVGGASGEAAELGRLQRRGPDGRNPRSERGRVPAAHRDHARRDGARAGEAVQRGRVVAVAREAARDARNDEFKRLALHAQAVRRAFFFIQNGDGPALHARDLHRERADGRAGEDDGWRQLDVQIHLDLAQHLDHLPRREAQLVKRSLRRDAPRDDRADGRQKHRRRLDEQRVVLCRGRWSTALGRRGQSRRGRWRRLGAADGGLLGLVLDCELDEVREDIGGLLCSDGQRSGPAPERAGAAALHLEQTRRVVEADEAPRVEVGARVSALDLA